MVDSGLMEIRTGIPSPRAYFTESGLGALRRLASDRRYMDQHKFAYVRRELGSPDLEGVTASSHMKKNEKDWTASFRQCQPRPKLRQSRRTRLAVDGISARLSGV